MPIQHIQMSRGERDNVYKISLAKHLIRRALLTLADLALDDQGRSWFGLRIAQGY